MPWLLWLGLTGAGATPLISLDRILAEPFESRVRQLRNLDSRRRAAFARIPFDAGESLPTRWRAVTAMGRLDAILFAPVIERALRSSEWFLRNAALIATLSGDRPGAVAAATRLLDDPALVVRTQAVRNLIHLDARASETKLWRALGDPRNFSSRGESLWVRAHIAEALAKFAGPGRGRAFRKLLLDEDPRVHRWAVRGLEVTSGRRLNDADVPVEVARQRWLAHLGGDTI